MARAEGKVRVDITLSSEMYKHLTILSNSFTEKKLEIHTKSQIVEEALRLYIIFLSERVNEEMKKEKPEGEN